MKNNLSSELPLLKQFSRFSFYNIVLLTSVIFLPLLIFNNSFTYIMNIIVFVSGILIGYHISRTNYQQYCDEMEIMVSKNIKKLLLLKNFKPQQSITESPNAPVITKPSTAKRKTEFLYID